MSASREKLAAVGTHRNPEHFKISIVQAALAGKTYSEIAAELGTNKGIVAGVVYRARKALGRTSPAPEKSVPPKMERYRTRSTKAVPLVEAPVVSEIVWQPRPIHIVDAGSNQCRWPLWKANAPFSEKFVCGNAVEAGKPYCSHCNALSVAPRRTDSFDKKHGFFKFTKRGRR